MRELDDSHSIKPCGMFGEKSYGDICDDLRANSSFKAMPGLGYISLIVKSGDDLRQE